jgi:glycyl-tRNA synthetase beta chain
MARFHAQGADVALPDDEALAALADFIADRLVHHLGQEGVPQDAVRAAIGAGPGGLATVAAWARALHGHRDDPALVRAGTAANRCRRIIAGSQHGLAAFASGGDPDEDALASALDTADADIATARAAGDPEAAIAAAEALGPPVDAFFEAVMVNADDPAVRDRRHALVRRAGEAYGQVADFEVLVLKGGE